MADTALVEPQAVDADTLDNVAESELEDALLAEFYAFTYEDAVLVGAKSGMSISPPKLSGKDSLSPTRKGGSPGKHDQLIATGPTASHVAAATVASSAVEPPMLSRQVLNAMLPPKSWSDESGKWQRVVRLAPSGRAEVVRLQHVFAQLLQEHQARGSAICPVREKFFLQVFEELIRHCACECPERGLLLLRLRDELRMTVEVYQTLYHNSIAYGRQKAVQAEAGIAQLDERIHQLQLQREQLGEQKQQLTHRILQAEAVVAEAQQERELRHRERVQFLRDQHVQFETFHGELTQDLTWK